MISELSVRNYRGFQDFSLRRCSAVNLFVGKNNTGKSSLLEALYLYACRMDVEVLQSIAVRRGEVIEDPRGREVFSVDLSHFFNGHRIKNSRAPSISSSGVSYAVKVDDAETIASDIELLRFDEPAPSVRQPLHSLKIVESRNGADKDIQEVTVFEQGGVSATRRNYNAVAARRKYHFLAPDSLDNYTLARLWNNILVSREEDSIVRALQILDDKVTSVAFLSGDPYSGRFVSKSAMGFVVGMEGVARRIPLGSLGDGMKRLMAIAAALSCAKNGAVFIDEIDSGLHYSAMRDLWRLVLRTAGSNNVQVFASTHSLDCIRGLSVLTEEALYRDFSLYSVNSADRQAVHYSAEEIPRIIRNEIEVRQ